MDQKNEIKERKTFTLKPINVRWLKRRALELSTPENKISDSALLDSLLDELRERAESKSPTPQKKTSAPALEFVTP